MRALRAVFFADPDQPVATFVTEADLNVPIEEARVDMESATNGLVICEEIEVDEGDSLQGFLLAFPEQEQMERERNMAILYHYDVAMLAHAKPNGLLMQSKNSPLSSEEIVYVLKAVCKNPAYEHQTLHALDEQGASVRVRDSEVVS
jgi:hypothetical protein